MDGAAAPFEVDLAARFAAVRAGTRALAVPLSAEDQQVQSMPDASPTKWHLAHTSWFFETFLLTPHLAGYREFDPRFGYLFNSYYEGVGERHPRARRGEITRPGVAEVLAYRAHVDAGMERLFAAGGEAFADLIELGLQHEQQHQELILMDIKTVLAANPFPSACHPSKPSFPAPGPLAFLDVEGGLVEIGHAGGGFHFDNEAPRHRVWLEPFAIADRLTTNGEWLAFIEDGGYARPELWLSDGWAAVNTQGLIAPLYWRAGERGWREYTLAGEAPIDPHAPVLHVSHYEADAYARWAGARLPNEAEWEQAATTTSGLRQLYDQAWQWTASAYLPYPRFLPAAGAVGEYNGKFMSGQMVMRGGAAVTPAGHVRATYRNFFPPGARWMYGGVRLTRDF
ncbi:MAG: hypothetical protein JWM33_1529 [Caulobacteraceae bacterium]|nr:hypothetical protein [Caulobacteraceae bacterium]